MTPILAISDAMSVVISPAHRDIHNSTRQLALISIGDLSQQNFGIHSCPLSRCPRNLGAVLCQKETRRTSETVRVSKKVFRHLQVLGPLEVRARKIKEEEVQAHRSRTRAPSESCLQGLQRTAPHGAAATLQSHSDRLCGH